MAEKAGGIMNIGDLVRYAAGQPRGHAYGVGLVTYVSHSVEAVTVLWADGTSSNHSSRWLIRIEEIK